MKRTRRALIILSLALAGCRGPVLSPTATPYTVDLHVVATTSAYPALQEVIAAYQPEGVLVSVETAAVNWEAALDLLQSGTVPYALTSYLPADSALWAAPLGWDGLAIVVHVVAPVPALSVADLRLLFQGRVPAWSALGGPDLPVTVVSRESGSGTRLAFEALVMDGRPVSPGARLALSSAGVIDVVASVPGAVGYVSMAYLNERVQTVPLIVGTGADPVLPTPQTVQSGAYPLRTPLLVVGGQAPLPGSTYYDWFAWMQSDAGQAVIGRHYGALR